MAITLTDEQEQAVALALSGIRDRRPMTRIGGYAGTGKTTLIHQILMRTDRRGVVCAYTGKAACVLRQKGIPKASTIHSLIYRPREVLDPQTKRPKMEFVKIEIEELDADFFVIDEASMVGKELLEDLVSFGRPIIAVGDPGQLPPVSRHDVNLMEDPDFVLQTIHRQAAGSGIIRLATLIRTQGIDMMISQIAAGDWDDVPDVQIRPKHEVRHDPDADVFICGFNRTRNSLNRLIRNRQGHEGILNEGERIIALANDRELGVFNGMMGTIIAIDGTKPTRLYVKGGDVQHVNRIAAQVLWDGQDEPRPVSLSDFAFDTEGPDNSVMNAHFGQLVVADYGGAITCHKAQGSQYDRVVVMNEACKYWTQARWLYTGCTRAAKYLAVGHEAA